MLSSAEPAPSAHLNTNLLTGGGADVDTIKWCCALGLWFLCFTPVFAGVYRLYRWWTISRYLPLCLSPGTLHTHHPAQAVSRSWSEASFTLQFFLVPSCHYLQSSLSYSWRPLAVPSAIRSGWNISISAGLGRGQFLCNIGPGIQRHQAVSSSHLIRQQIHHAEYCFIQHPPPAASSSCLTDHSCSWSHIAGEETRLFCLFCPSSAWFLAPQKIWILNG